MEVVSSGSAEQAMLTRVCPSRADVLAALARLLDYLPGGGVPHHARVAVLAARMASLVRRTDRLDTFYAGLVHDIGLLRDNREPARSPGPEEQANQPLAWAHPLIGAQLVAEVPELFALAEIIRDHHECANGHGYPLGKSGDEIAPAAQILRFADTCDLVLHEQTWPELIPFLDAVRTRTLNQVHTAVLEAGMEVLGQQGFHAQLLGEKDVLWLLESTVHRFATEDVVAVEAEITSLMGLFAHVIDSHSADKTGHSRRVARLSASVAETLGLAAEDVARVQWAALVHDLGLVAVPRHLLDQPRFLAPEELEQIRRQSALTKALLGAVAGLEDVAVAGAAHGEAFDGSGYPDGLTGREVPLAARIIAVCEAFDALTSRRPHREAREVSLAVDILVKGSGSAFDPAVVSAAVPVLLVAGSVGRPHASVA